MAVDWRMVKNAGASLGRGSAAALVSLLLPPVLVRHMAADAYSVWLLVLQVAAYASYLNFGLQTAIGRYVAFATEKRDFEQRDSVYSTAFAGLCCAALVAYLALIVATIVMPSIFPSVPARLVPQMRLALLIVGLTLALELPASGWNGVFVGVARYEIPALTTGLARIIVGVGLVAAAVAGSSIVAMAVIVGVVNCTSYVAQYFIAHRVVPDLRFRMEMVSRSKVRELSSYCFGLTVMSVAMFLITGLDLLLVGRFDFSAVIPYSVAASVVALMTGFVSSILGVILPHAATLHAQERPAELGELVVSATRISVLLLVLIGLPLVIYAGPILRVWIGPAYVMNGVPILSTLIVANLIRQIGAPYATVLVGTGHQNYILISPVAEGVTNFVASVLLGLNWGGIGVAVGTLLGSFVSIAAYLFYSVPRTQFAITVSRWNLVTAGILTPMLYTCPLLAAAAANWTGLSVGPIGFGLAMMLSLLGAGLLLIRTHIAPKSLFNFTGQQNELY